MTHQAVGEYELAAAEQFSTEATVGTPQLDALGARLLAEFAQAELDRRQTEERWLRDLRQYKGIYDPEVLALIGANRSKAFVRKTRVKVKTADSRVMDLLFPSGSDKNWEVDTTPVPSVPDEVRRAVAQQLGAQQQQMAQALAAQGQQVGPVRVTKEMVDQAVLDMCKKAAKGMGKVIDDQLSEVRYKAICKQVVHSGHLYGTGILKGPLVERKVRSRFVQENGRWTEKSESYVVPFVDFVPVWRVYPDMNADCLDKCRYIYERHQMTPADMSELAARKSFRGEVIREYLRSHPQGEVRVKYVDNELKIIGDRSSKQGKTEGQYEVLERWGWLSGEDLCEVGVEVPKERLHESFFCNVWLLPSGQVVKAVIQPINGVTWPYHFYYFDKDETSIFGEGLATVMRDDQIMLNAATRLMLDNGAVAGGPMFEVTPTLLSSLERVDEMHAWKVFMRNQTNPGERAVKLIEAPAHLGELAGLADRFENNADEVSAIPRYMTGENVNSGAAGTAAGMSMLMGASNIMIKDLITAWDEVTNSFITALYRWNMQFHPDNTIKGDFDVKARGVASLVAREVRARQLDNFAAMTANPMDAPYVKRDKLLRQRAEANELSDVVKTDEEVQQEQDNELARQQQQMQQQMAQLQLRMTQMQVAVEEGKAAKLAAETDRINAGKALEEARALNARVEAIYAALQAGGVAATNPHIAPAGDEILRSAGFQDVTPDKPIGNIVASQDAPMPAAGDLRPMQPNGHLGQRQGIETASLD